MRNLVVCSTPGSPWLSDFLKSLEGIDTDNTQIIVLQDFNWELGKLKFMFMETIVKDFVMFQDSCVLLKPQELMDLFYSVEGSVALTNCPTKMGMYMGKWTRNTLGKCYFPLVRNKKDSVNQEIKFAQEYCKQEKDIPTLFPGVADHTAHGKEWRHGRENLVLGNEYFLKFKGDWGQRPL